MDGDLLGLAPDLNVTSDNFNNAFWGLKYNGYDVLHNSLKHSPVATRELSDFIREVALADDTYSKVLCRLGKQEKSNSSYIFISPIWKIVKSFVEKSGAAHMELSKKLYDLSSEMRLYADRDLKERHRPHKAQFQKTAVATEKIQQVSQNLSKARESKQRLESSSSVGSKFENRLKKTSDDLKKNVETFNNALNVYETNFNETTRIFTELETLHVNKLSTFLKGIQSAHESCNVMNHSINEAFETSINQASPNYLISQFSKHRGTGVERPKPERVDEVQNIDDCQVPKLTLVPPSRHDVTSSSINKSPKQREHSPKELVNEVFVDFPEIKPTRGAPPPPLPKPRNDKSDTDSEEESNEKSNCKSKNEETEKSVVELPDDYVDSEGYSIRKPERKESTSSSWSSDDDKKIDTYRIKVKIRPKEEVEPLNQELIKLSGPILPNSSRSKTRYQRSPHTLEESEPTETNSPKDDKLTEEKFSDITLNTSMQEVMRDQDSKSQTPTNQSTPLPKIIPTTNLPLPVKSQYSTETTENALPLNYMNKMSLSPAMTGEPRAMTPLITGGSLMGEISWLSGQNAGGAPIASVESLSPTSSTDSPYFGVDIPVRVAVTETINAKFLGVGDGNTKIAINAEIYLDFATTSIKYLNKNHNLQLQLTGSVDSVRVNPTFSTFEETADDKSITFNPNDLKKSLSKMMNEKPSETHFMLKVASYRVRDSLANLPLLLLSYWKKENDDYRVRVVAKASTTIKNLRLLSKANFDHCLSDPGYAIDKGLLTFSFSDVKAGKEKTISAQLVNCPVPSAFAAQFDIEDRSVSSVVCPKESSFKISYLRRRIKTGVFISEPIL